EFFGFLQGYYGLGGAILIQLYQIAWKGNPANFILLLVLLPTSVCLSFMTLVNYDNTGAKDDKKHLNAISRVALITAAYLKIIILLQNIAHSSSFLQTLLITERDYQSNATSVVDSADYELNVEGLIFQEMEMMNTKWIATVASIWIQTCSGAYTFGIYSPVLKSSQGYDQSTLDLISVFKEVGGNAGVLAGVLYAFVTTGNSRRRLGCFSGPWVVIFAGAVQWFVGFFMMWASVVGLIPRLPVPVMCLFIAIAYHGQVFCNTTNLVSGVHNFRDYGGSILGILKLYQIAWKGNPANFILLLALLPTSVWLSFMTLVRNYDKTGAEDDKKHLNAISTVALITAAYLMIIILLENIFTLPSLARIISFAFLMLLVVSPLLIVIRAHKKDSSSSSRTLLITERDHQSDATRVVDSADYVKLPSEEGQSTGATIDDERYLSDEETTNIWQIFRSGNFWLLFVAMFCGSGTVTAVMDNLSQIGESLGYTAAEINSMISLMSIWNFLGRMGAGVVSDMFLHRYGWTRPIFMVATLAILVIGQVVIVIDFPKSLFLGSVLVGICDGSLWLLMTIMTSELFSLRHMGTMFNTISIASPVGSYIFSVKIVGYFYDMVADSETHVCLGTRCFNLSLLIMASVTSCGALVALALFFRTRNFYRQSHGNPANFILLLALLPTAVWLSLMTLVRNYDNTSTKLDDKKHLNAISAVALITAAYLTIIILLDNIFTLPSSARIISFAFLMLLVMSPLVIVLRAHKKDSSTFSQTLLITERDYQSNATSVVDSADYVKLQGEEGESTGTAIDDERYLSDEENMNIWQAFRRGNFWLLSIAMFCGLGPVSAVMDNLSQIGESLGYTTPEINSMISLMSIWNFLGRIGAGFVSDMFLHRYGWTRPIFIVVILAVLVIGQVVIVIDFSKSLFLGSVLVGICDGSLWLLMTIITSELFGLRHMGTIFNTISISAPVGSYIFSVKIVGYFYDMVADSETHVMEIMNTRWIATVAGIWMQACSGAYTFGIYSPVLKSSQGYDQSTLDLVSVFKDIGSCTAVLGGVLYTFVTTGESRRRLGCFSGPWVVIFAGAVQYFAGFFMMWASVVGLIPRLPVPGYYGLGGAILIQLYQIAWKGDPATYILLLALLPTAVWLSLMTLVRNYDNTSRKEDKKHLNAISAVALITAAYLMIIILLESIFSMSSLARIISFAFLMLLLVYPLGIVIRAHKEDSSSFSKTLLITERDYQSNATSVVDSADYEKLPSEEGQSAGATFDDERYLSDEETMNIWQALRSGNFWLLFSAMFCAFGTVVAVMDNLSQIGESLGYTAAEINSMISLMSTWNFLGRIGAGVVSDMCMHRYGWTRPIFVVVTLAILLIGQIVVINFPKSLFLGSALVGICDGSMWLLMTIITSELFGLQHMGTIFNTIAIASPVGSYIFSVKIVGYFYDMVADSETHVCLGTRCFMSSLLIMASVTSCGALLALALFSRTRRFYQQTIQNTKWMATFAGIWIQTWSGAYTFGIYSPILKSSQGYDQSTLDFVAVFKDIGGSVGILSGFLYAFVTTGRNGLGCFGGPWVVIFAGAVQWFVGFFMTWASVVGLIPRLPVPMMCLFTWVAFHGQNFCNTSNLVTGAHNFRDYRGSILGIMKGYYGLGGAIVIQFYQTAWKGDPFYFLPWCQRAHKEDSYILLETIEGDYIQGNDSIEPEDYEKLPSGEGLLMGDSVDDQRDLSVEESMNVLQALGSGNFWLLFVAIFCGLGNVGSLIDNFSQIGESFGYTKVEINSFISLMSIWTFLGRIGAGFGSDMFLHRFGWPRPLFLVVTLAMLVVGQIAIAIDFPKSLFLASVIVGTCDGSLWLLMTIISSEIFGLQHMGTIYNTIAISFPVGSYLFSVKVVGYFYDMVADRETHTCLGTHCFMFSLLVMASVASFGALVALALFFRTRRDHQQGREETWSGAYTFGIYSPILKSSQGYDQSTLNLVSVFKHIGGSVGILGGLLYSFVTTGNSRGRFGCFSGPWVVIFAGAVQWFVGLFMMWVSVVGLIPRLPVPVMCFLIWMAHHGQAFCNTSNLVTGVHNFRDYGGTILGIMKGYYGLGGAILIQFYQMKWEGDPATSILLLALLPTTIWLSFMTLVRNYDTSRKDDKKHLNAISTVSLITAAYLTVIIVLENIFTLSSWDSWARIISCAFLLLLVISPLGIVIRAHKEDSCSLLQISLIKERGNEVNACTAGDPADYEKLPSEEGKSKGNILNDESYLPEEESMNILQALRNGNFWLLFVAMFCGFGSGYAVIDNFSQIGESLGYTTTEINSMISLMNIWTFLGRIGAGFTSDMFLHRFGWARPLFIVVIFAMLVIGLIVIAIGFPKSLLLGSVLVGLCDGSLWLLMTIITSEIFGLQHMATLYNTIAISSPVGTYIFSVKIVGYFYDMVADSETHTCLGTRCFMLSLLIMASVASFGALIALVLYFRTRREINREMNKLKLNTKWFSTVASIWIQCTSGSLYTFSIYSPTLKSTQAYDQSTLDTVSVFKDIGANCGVLSGVLYTRATSDHHHRYRILGPWVVLLAGAIQCFTGYFLMWATVSGLFPRPPVAVMCLFMFVAAHAQSFFNTANVVTSVKNFPNYSGTAVGIMKGFLGLSGAILIQVYQTIFSDKPKSFLLMLALLPTFNTLLLMWVVRIHSSKEGNEKKYLDYFSLVALVLAIYLMVIIILEHLLSFQYQVRFTSFVLLMVLLVSPLLIAIKARRDCSSSLVSENERLLDEPKMPERHDYVGGHEDLNLLQAVSTLDFWILFLAMACGMGSGLATVNNMSQVGGSLGYQSFETNTLVSLWSIWNFLGRFGAGYISDYFLHARGWARPLFMVITLAGMSIGYVVIASGFPGALYLGSVLVGVCYGSQWSLMPTIASEIFGVRHMGTIFNTITIASPVGSYIFSVRVVGYIYDKQASGGHTCTGAHCFLLSFLIMASATLLGSLAAFGLFLRTKAFYNQKMKTTKGGKVMNPTDAYRKELRKKELKRNKKERKKVREVGILKKDPEVIREQIEKLEMMKSDGALDKARKHRKRQLEDTLNLVLKKRREYEDKMKEKGETPVMFRRTSAEEEERAKHPRPEDSVYYHPTLNPLGAPPPGKPPMYKSSIGPRIPLSGASSSTAASSSGTENDDPASAIAPLPPPPPLPLPESGDLASVSASGVPASLPLPPPPPMPPNPPASGLGVSLPPPPPPPGPPPKDQVASHTPLPPPPPLQQPSQPPPPGTINSEEKNLSALPDEPSYKETIQASASLPPPPPPPGMLLKPSSSQPEGAASDADANNSLATKDNLNMVPLPPPPRLQAPVPGSTLVPTAQPDVLPPGISRFPPPPPPPNMRPPIPSPGLPGQVAPPGVMVPLVPRPPYPLPPGPPPMMRPPLPPGPPPTFQEDAMNRPPVPQKPSYVKSAASTVVKRPLAQHTPELTAMVPASVRVRREAALPKPKSKAVLATTAAATTGAAAPTTVKPELANSSSAAKTQSIDDSYMAFLEDMKALGALDRGPSAVSVMRY
ncbi:hypothetical protein Tsubulata_006676, partial [Turnera subulata]